MIYLSPRSLTNKIHSSIAFASTSSSPKGNLSFWLITPMIWCLSFLINTQIPQQLSSLNTAPSTFTLYHPWLGGLQQVLSRGIFWLRGGGDILTELLNQDFSFSRYSLCLFTPSFMLKQVLVLPKAPGYGGEDFPVNSLVFP